MARAKKRGRAKGQTEEKYNPANFYPHNAFKGIKDTSPLNLDRLRKEGKFPPYPPNLRWEVHKILAAKKALYGFQKHPENAVQIVRVLVGLLKRERGLEPHEITRKEFEEFGVEHSLNTLGGLGEAMRQAGLAGEEIRTKVSSVETENLFKAIVHVKGLEKSAPAKGGYTWLLRQAAEETGINYNTLLQLFNPRYARFGAGGDMLKEQIRGIRERWLDKEISRALEEKGERKQVEVPGFFNRLAPHQQVYRVIGEDEEAFTRDDALERIRAHDPFISRSTLTIALLRMAELGELDEGNWGEYRFTEKGKRKQKEHNKKSATQLVLLTPNPKQPSGPEALPPPEIRPGGGMTMEEFEERMHPPKLTPEELIRKAFEDGDLRGVDMLTGITHQEKIGVLTKLVKDHLSKHPEDKLRVYNMLFRAFRGGKGRQRNVSRVWKAAGQA